MTPQNIIYFVNSVEPKVLVRNRLMFTYNYNAINVLFYIPLFVDICVDRELKFWEYCVTKP